MFEPMLVCALVGGAASYLNLAHHYRHRLGPMTVREARQLAALPCTPIAEARSGLVKIVGEVHPTVVETSYYDRLPCAALELLHYDVVAGRGGARRVLTRAERSLHPFWIDDGTGRVRIDPTTARIDYETEAGDAESATEERRIRVGARVAVLGHVRRVAARLAQPMREASGGIEQQVEFEGAPLLTWRCEPEVYPRLAPPASGVVLSAGAVGLAVLGSLLKGV